MTPRGEEFVGKSAESKPGLAVGSEFDPGVLAIDSFLTEEQEERILSALAAESAENSEDED